MNENLLMTYQSFEEYPNFYLEVNNKSNTFYIKINDESYIARQNIDNIISDNDIISVQYSYYNVIDNSLIISITDIYNEFEKIGSVLESNIEFEILPLYKKIGLNENTVALNLNDINNIINQDKNKQKKFRRN